MIAAARLTYRVRMAAVDLLGNLRTPYIWINRGVTARNVITAIAAILVVVFLAVTIKVEDVPRSPL